MKRENYYFISREHFLLGGNHLVDIGNTENEFKLEYGYILALVGDWFSYDDFFELAKIPGDKGKLVGTRDEIICAIKIIHDEEFFETNTEVFKTGRWKDYDFPREVVEKVRTRLYHLASENDSHFVAPYGWENNKPILKENQTNTWSTYKQYHKKALWAAYQAGLEELRRGKTNIQIIESALGRFAMAKEAAAQHWLTDSFASGHLTTPVSSIKEYWNKKCPLFWDNLLNEMALDISNNMKKDISALLQPFVSLRDIFEKVRKEIRKATENLPQIINIGSLLCKIFHDYDNFHGVKVKDGILYGDGKIQNEDGIGWKLAKNAIEKAQHELVCAFQDGLEGTKLTKEDFGNIFKSEQYYPRPILSNRHQFQADNFEVLSEQYAIQNNSIKIKDLIAKVFAPDGELYKILRGLSLNFPSYLVETKNLFLGEINITLKPRKAYVLFVDRLSRKPIDTITAIIDWAPTHELSNSGKHSVCVDILKGLERKGKLALLTLKSKEKYIEELLTGSEEEKNFVSKIYQETSEEERRILYQNIEKHPWKGEWKYGIFSIEDKQKDALNWEQLNTIKILLNKYKLEKKNG